MQRSVQGERDAAAGIEAHVEGAVLVAAVQALNGAEFPIRQTLLAIWRRALHSVAHREGALGLAADRHAPEPSGIVRDGLAGVVRRQRVVWDLLNLFRLGDQGRLVEEWVRTDYRSFLRQLGAPGK
jgi:hypothetical protein